MRTRVLIADDHAPVRQGLRSFIDPDPEFDVVGEAVDGNDTVRMALELRPDLIVLDNSMPGMTGLEVAEKLRATLPETKIVFLTLDAGIHDLALATGAVAHVSKDQSPDEILRAMRKAAALTSRRAARADRASAGGESQFAQVLVSANMLSADQMEQIDRGRGAQQTLSNAILHSGLVAEDVLASALARFANSSLVSLATAVTPAVANQLPRRFCELRACVLIEPSRPPPPMPVADPLDEAALAEPQDMLGAVKLAVVTATLSEVREALKPAYLPSVFLRVASPLPFGPPAVPPSKPKHSATPQDALPRQQRFYRPRHLAQPADLLRCI